MPLRCSNSVDLPAPFGRRTPPFRPSRSERNIAQRAPPVGVVVRMLNLSYGMLSPQ